MSLLPALVVGLKCALHGDATVLSARNRGARNGEDAESSMVAEPFSICQTGVPVPIPVPVRITRSPSQSPSPNPTPSQSQSESVCGWLRFRLASVSPIRTGIGIGTGTSFCRSSASRAPPGCATLSSLPQALRSLRGTPEFGLTPEFSTTVEKYVEKRGPAGLDPREPPKNTTLTTGETAGSPSFRASARIRWLKGAWGAHPARRKSGATRESRLGRAEG